MLEVILRMIKNISNQVLLRIKSSGSSHEMYTEQLLTSGRLRLRDLASSHFVAAVVRFVTGITFGLYPNS